MTGVHPPSRLFAAPEPTLAAHRGAYGDLPDLGPGLIGMIDEAGLSGRGGAGFPTARKLAAVNGSKPVVVANGAEGEPLSRKDVHLLTWAPHLVLDGLDCAASAIGADKAYLYVHAEAVTPVADALSERRAAGLDPHRVIVVEAPDRFVAGEESAAIRRIEGGPALPRDRTVVAARSGVRGRPTVVNNVETLAHMALIARFGPDWFRSVGDDEHPGTMLVTLSGAVCRHGVVEVPTDAVITELLQHEGGTDPATLQAILVGGYHGSWISAAELDGLRISRSALQSLGAHPGAGIVHGLDRASCGVAAVAEITDYLAEQSARQCGPCLNGLPALAGLTTELVRGRGVDHLVKDIRRLARVVEGRGACRHPDGTARMLRSALRTFAADIELHGRRRCAAASANATPGTAQPAPSPG